jgi:putative transcriptional regulator
MSERLELYVPGQPFDGGTYHYTECGLSYVHLQNGFSEEVDPDYGRLVSFTNVPDLHKAIALHVIFKREPITPSEFRFLRKQMRLTQAALATEYGVSSQTIANYEKGETPIPKVTERFLKMQSLLAILPEDARAAVLQDLEEQAKAKKRKRTKSETAERRSIVHVWEEAGAQSCAGV